MNKTGIAVKFLNYKITPSHIFLFCMVMSFLFPLTSNAQEQEQDLVQQRLENQYQGFISKGNFALSNKSYQDAKGNYQKALEMKPTETYPLKQIQKIDSIMLVDQTYNSSIERADYFFKVLKYKEAKNFYLNAIKIKGKSKYAEMKVDFIDSLLNVKEELAYLDDLEDFHFQKKGLSTEEQYNKYIKEADAAMQSGAYNKAGRFYEWALLVLPDKKYAQEQLDKIFTILEEQNEAKANMEKQERMRQDSLRKVKTTRFYKAIENANLSIGNNQFELAITYYNEAINIWPEKKSDVEQLIEFVNKSMANREKNQALYDRIIADADREYLNQEYNNCLDLYKRANDLIPDNPYPLQQIKIADSLIVHIEKPYLQIIEDAELLEDQNLFSEAIKKYEQAASLKPAAKLPVSKINEIKRKYENIQRTAEKSELNQASYLDIIKKADLAFRNKDYANAALNYELAANIKPFESYPKDQLSKLKEIQDNNRNTYKQSLSEKAKNKYDEAIKIADSHFKAGKYTEAKVYYKRAFLYKPDEAYPYNQLAVIDDLYSESIRRNMERKAQKDTERQQITKEIKSGLSKTEKEELTRFQNLVKQGDNAFDQENYSVARVYYKRALTLNPKDEFIVKQLDKIERQLKDRKNQVKNVQYRDNIDKANKAFQDGDFSVARFFYQNAQKISPAEEYPKKQLEAIQKIEETLLQEEMQQKYIEIIQKADNAYYDENFPVAKYQYNKALEVKPDDDYAKGRLKNIQTVLELQQNDKISKAYLDELRTADDAFYLGDFAKAAFYYKKAMQLKPEEDYPKQQVKKIDELTK